MVSSCWPLHLSKLAIECWKAALEQVNSCGRKIFCQKLTSCCDIPGIWALDLAAQQPTTVNIMGIDISSRQYPVSCPSNVNLSICSITNLPDEWRNTFALVHQRLMMVSLTASTWKTAISEIFRVLAPGGWVELVEVATLKCTLGVGPHSGKLVELIHKLYSDKEVVQDLDIQLPIILRAVGFVNIEIKMLPMPVKQSIGDDIDRTKLMYDLWTGMKKPMLETGGYGIVDSEQEFDKMMEGAMGEWKDSVESTFNYFMVYAQKKAEC